MIKRILLLESNEFLGRVIKYKLEAVVDCQVLWYKTFIDFENGNHNISKIDLGILDYKIDDQKDGKAIDYSFNNGLPTIILTDKITEDIQSKIIKYRLIDYILKGNNNTIFSLIDTVSRYFKNPETGILTVVPDKKLSSELFSLLDNHKYSVYQSDNSEDALNILTENFNSIKMVIISYEIDELTGIELTEKIRENFHLDRLAIIGILQRGNFTKKIEFIKSGVNDFVTTPFISELLYCRITQSLKTIEYFNKIKELAIVDQLTGLNNRHYLKETGEFIFENAKRHNLTIVAAMIDIDDFKVINDTYGHDVGDIVLKEIGIILKSYIRKSDIVVRYGGEEFLIIGNNLANEKALDYFKKLRKQVEDKTIDIGIKTINVTVSIGVSVKIKTSLEELISSADRNLYRAKSLGKNRVCI